MTYPISAITSVTEALLRSNAYRSTKYISERLVVRATRRNKFKRTEMVLTIGKPNFLEREFIKTAKKAGEKFPIKNVILKFKKK